MKTPDRPIIVMRIAAAPPDAVDGHDERQQAPRLTSPTAAQARAVVPSGVLARPRSSRMRASTGNAVMLMAMPMNRAKARNGTPAGA